jgi:peptidyl-prolyl cis-trans isomerase C
VVFNDTVGEVHGPVKTQFGYHLIEITSRSE